MSALPNCKLEIDPPFIVKFLSNVGTKFASIPISKDIYSPSGHIARLNEKRNKN